MEQQETDGLISSQSITIRYVNMYIFVFFFLIFFVICIKEVSLYTKNTKNLTMQRSDGGGSFQADDMLNGRLLCGCDDVHACAVRSSNSNQKKRKKFM